jgi:ATP-binding cassette subfamily B protein RaxB
VQAVENVAVVYFAVRFAIDGGFTVGMIFAFLAYRLQFATATKRLIDEGMEFRLLNLHLDRLSDIALEPEDGGFLETAPPLGHPPARITLSGVVYAYGEHDPPVLNGIDLEIAAGEHVAITGPSGGGKSTLVKVLLGLLEPQAGSVAIDGVPLARYGRRNFRDHVGAVLQDDLLFAGTIAENVAGFDEVDADRLAEALEAAAIAGDIARMPMRHMTLVGDMGASLSGGQRQRILLARALYRRPSILVMDEGTAHLDAEHERTVNAAIAAMGITRIIVAHRRETIDAADRIVAIAEGRLVSDRAG